MLKTVVDDELRQIGLSREVINRIQRARKAGQILPTDEIEVYYKLNGEAAADGAWLNQVMQKHGEKIAKYIKRPFLPATAMPKMSPVINETAFEFVPEGAPKDAKPEVVDIMVCKPSP
jgi:isoleucyl-tRNA synthetase